MTFGQRRKAREFEVKVKQSYTPSHPGINGLLRASTCLTSSHVEMNTPGVGGEDIIVTSGVGGERIVVPPGVGGERIVVTPGVGGVGIVVTPIRCCKESHACALRSFNQLATRVCKGNQ
jgi:hypothetical protein